MNVRVEIARRSGIADPEGTTVRRALGDLGYDVDSVEIGRVIVLSLATDDKDEAIQIASEMCERLLTNPVIEDYVITLES